MTNAATLMTMEQLTEKKAQLEKQLARMRNAHGRVTLQMDMVAAELMAVRHALAHKQEKVARQRNAAMDTVLVLVGLAAAMQAAGMVAA